MGHDALIDKNGQFNDSVEISGGSNTLRIVASLPTRRCAKSPLLDDVFGTSFAVNRTKLRWKDRQKKDNDAVSVAQVGDRTVVLDGCRRNDEVTRKVLILQACLADVAIFNVFHADLGRREGTDIDGVLRSFLIDLSHTCLGDPSEPLRTKLIIVVRDYDDKQKASAVEKGVLDRIRRLWLSVPQEQKVALSAFLDTSVICVPHHQLHERFMHAVALVKREVYSELGRDAHSKGIEADSFLLYSKHLWDSFDRGAELRPKLEDLIVMAACEGEARKQRAEAKPQLENWRQMVEASKVVDDFGFGASMLLLRTFERYDMKTASCQNQRIRKRFREGLRDYLEENIRYLFIEQMKLLQASACHHAEKMLFKEVEKNGFVASATADSLARKEVQRFCDLAEKVEVRTMHLSSYGARNELESVLHNLVSSLANSPRFLSHAVNRSQRQQRAPQRTYIPGNVFPGVSLGVNFASELRVDGFGNGQMYASSAFGPHTFNFAAANDRDAARQEGKGDVPLLRVQPSLRFDVDANYFVENVKERYF